MVSTMTATRLFLRTKQTLMVTVGGSVRRTVTTVRLLPIQALRRTQVSFVLTKSTTIVMAMWMMRTPTVRTQETMMTPPAMTTTLPATMTTQLRPQKKKAVSARAL